MTGIEIDRVDFTAPAVRSWSHPLGRHQNWPIVYALNDARQVYVGETLNAAARLRQHLDNPEKHGLTTARVVIDDRFNKSVCLDLESFLIRMFAGDGKYEVLNRNEGITDADYYDRHTYRRSFQEIFDALRAEGLFNSSIKDIENSDLYKLSPFKSLNPEQAIAVEDIVDGLLGDLATGAESTAVIQGDPGTGKTIVAIFLMKLLQDLAAWSLHENEYSDSMFSEFFVPENAAALKDLRMALVVPQQSLRESIKRVFQHTSGLSKRMVLSPFEVGAAEDDFDLLIVDESHRLNQRANQASGVQNAKFRDITTALFGWDDTSKTQLDWITAKSRHRILLLDAAQSVRPADLPRAAVDAMVAAAKRDHRRYRLHSQMRVQGGADYVDHVRSILGGTASGHLDLGEYEFTLFDDLGAMRDAIVERDRTHGLSRLVAGYAWEWRSKKDRSAFDISIDGVDLRWNSTAKDWIASQGSLAEVGSIHTVQGYDLNYAGVIIGPELTMDAETGELRIDRAKYADKKGQEDNPRLGQRYTDADLLRFVQNVYGVLMTRGIRGTFVYVCDPVLREWVRLFIHSGAPPAR